MGTSSRLIGRSALLSSVAVVALTGGLRRKIGVYQLGEIYVSGAQQGDAGVGSSTVTREQTWTFEKKTLDEVVNLIPGVTSTLDANGRRNESDIFVRGFGRWQVPLTIDGVRVYLPADNRPDYAGQHSGFLQGD